MLTGGEYQLTRNLKVKDFLKSRIAPGLVDYRLNSYQLGNLRRLAPTIEALARRIGSMPTITSGGRPQDAADFVEALKAQGKSAASNSQHNEFAAADLSWRDPADTARAYEIASRSDLWLQVIYDVQANYLHVSVADARRPKLKRLRKVKR